MIWADIEGNNIETAYNNNNFHLSVIEKGVPTHYMLKRPNTRSPFTLTLPGSSDYGVVNTEKKTLSEVVEELKSVGWLSEGVPGDGVHVCLCEGM